MGGGGVGDAEVIAAPRLRMIEETKNFMVKVLERICSGSKGMGGCPEAEER